MLQKGCIVIVEDDDLIRELLGRWLREAGYEVVAGSPESTPLKHRPRLVIANISNPQRSSQTSDALQAVYGAPILLISARFRAGLGTSETAALRLGVRNVLPKPFTREELLTAVNDSIDSV